MKPSRQPRPPGRTGRVRLLVLLLLPLVIAAAVPAPPVASPTNTPAVLVSPTNTPAALGIPTNPPPPPPLAPATETLRAIATNNLVPLEYRNRLDLASRQRREQDPAGAEKLLAALLAEAAPREVHRIALLEMAAIAEETRQFPKAQQILAQFVQRFPDDPIAPEALLRQGLAYRQMGANVLALSKFYTVMSTALNLKLDGFEHYQLVVLRAQTEIAETYFLQGKFDEAADFLTRLLRLENPSLNRPHVLSKLVRVLSALARHPEVVTQARTFIEQHPQAGDLAEVRFLLADSLKKLGRNHEAMQEVLALLQSQQDKTGNLSANWTYWQQRTGNDIANQLYKEGDYLNALQIYLTLAGLSEAPAWQLPVWYQIGLVYERLQQPKMAADAYGKITARAKDFATNAPAPTLAIVVDMAQWRRAHLQWQTNAEHASLQLKLAPVTAPPPAKAPATTTPPAKAPGIATPPAKAPVTVTPSTNAPVAAPPPAKAPVTTALSTNAPVTAIPSAKAPVTGTLSTNASVIATPPAKASATTTPSTNAPVTAKAPVTATPSTNAPVTVTPSTNAPVIAPTPTKAP